MPPLRDRVAQRAGKLVREPLFAADCGECAYGVRPKRDAQQAVGAIREALSTAPPYGLDADLQPYCDPIAHEKLRDGSARRVRYWEDVRHIPWRQIPFTERRGSEDKTPGSTTYLEAKAKGDSSMSIKRRASEGVYGMAPQDPRDTVSAPLPKPQFPAMEAYIPCRQRLMAGSPR